MATALSNLETVTPADCTTLASITAALASANGEMASLRRKLKIQSNPAEKQIQAWELRLDALFFLWEGTYQCILQVAEVRTLKGDKQGKQNGRERKIMTM